LLSHHPPCGVLGEAEPLPDLDPGLQRVTLGRPLVADAAEVPGLVGENGEGAGGLARGDLALEREPVEVEAALGRQVGEVASDGGDVVCVLDGADVVAGFVAVDRDRSRRDPRSLVGEARRRLRARVRIERVPAGAALGEPEDECERTDDGEAGEEAAKGPPTAPPDGRRRHSCFFLGPLARCGDQRRDLVAGLARVRDPELFASLADEQQIVRLDPIAVALPIDGLSSLRRRRTPFASEVSNDVRLGQR